MLRGFIVKTALLFFIFYVVYQNRYRIFNRLLGFEGLRHFVISKSFGWPWLREKVLDRFLFSEV